MGAGGAPPVPTFVIGVFAPGAAAQTAQTNLDMLAKAGQNSTTATAVIIDTGQNVATALQNALKAVQSKAIACEYKLPAGGVDFKQVNVSFTNGSGSTTIGHATIDGTDRRGLRRARRLVLRQGSRHRHADQDHRLPGELLDVPDRPERPRRRRARLPDHRRRLVAAA